MPEEKGNKLCLLPLIKLNKAANAGRYPRDAGPISWAMIQQLLDFAELRGLEVKMKIQIQKRNIVQALKEALLHNHGQTLIFII